MNTVSFDGYCFFKNDYYYRDSVENALKADDEATKLKQQFWIALDSHFLKSKVNLESFAATILSLYNNHFSESHLIEEFQKISNLANNPDRLKPYYIPQKILKITAVVGALIFLAAAILAFVKLHYNYLDIPFSHLYLASIGIGLLTFALIGRWCLNSQSNKRAVNEAYDELWRPIFDYIYDMPIKVTKDIICNETNTDGKNLKLDNEKVWLSFTDYMQPYTLKRIDQDYIKYHASINSNFNFSNFEVGRKAN